MGSAGSCVKKVEFPAGWGGLQQHVFVGVFFFLVLFDGAYCILCYFQGLGWVNYGKNLGCAWLISSELAMTLCSP